jgi:hypothetical protein
MTAAACDELLDVLQYRPDLAGAGLELVAELIRRDPGPPGCLLDVRGAHEALADMVVCIAHFNDAAYADVVRHMWPVVHGIWLSSLVPVLIVADARGDVAYLDLSRRVFAAIYGESVANEWLAWIHTQRVDLEKRMQQDAEWLSGDGRGNSGT